MNTYEWYLFGHICGVFLLLAATGATTGAGIALGKVTRASTAVVLLSVMRVSEYAVRSAGAILVIVFGALLIEEADYSWGDAWISAALTILVVALAVDHGFLLRRLKASLRLAQELGDGPLSPELQARVKDPATAVVGTILDLSLFAVLFLMIARPGA